MLLVSLLQLMTTKLLYYNSYDSIEYSEEVTQQSQHKRQFSMDEVDMPIEEQHAKKKTKVESKVSFLF
jgi:hypothetical protein